MPPPPQTLPCPPPLRRQWNLQEWRRQRIARRRRDRLETGFLHVLLVRILAFFLFWGETAWGAEGVLGGGELHEHWGACNDGDYDLWGRWDVMHGRPAASRCDVGLGYDIVLGGGDGGSRHGDGDARMGAAAVGSRCFYFGERADGGASSRDGYFGHPLWGRGGTDWATKISTGSGRGRTASQMAVVDRARGDALDRGLPPSADDDAVTTTTACDMPHRSYGSMSTRERPPHPRHHRHYSSLDEAPCRYGVRKGRRGRRSSGNRGRHGFYFGDRLCMGAYGFTASFARANAVLAGWRSGIPFSFNLCVNVSLSDAIGAGRRRSRGDAGTWRGTCRMEGAGEWWGDRVTKDGRIQDHRTQGTTTTTSGSIDKCTVHSHPHLHTLTCHVTTRSPSHLVVCLTCQCLQIARATADGDGTTLPLHSPTWRQTSRAGWPCTGAARGASTDGQGRGWKGMGMGLMDAALHRRLTLPCPPSHDTFRCCLPRLFRASPSPVDSWMFDATGGTLSGWDGIGVEVRKGVAAPCSRGCLYGGKGPVHRAEGRRDAVCTARGLRHDLPRDQHGQPVCSYRAVLDTADLAWHLGCLGCALMCGMNLVAMTILRSAAFAIGIWKLRVARCSGCGACHRLRCKGGVMRHRRPAATGRAVACRWIGNRRHRRRWHGGFHRPHAHREDRHVDGGRRNAHGTGDCACEFPRAGCGIPSFAEHRPRAHGRRRGAAYLEPLPAQPWPPSEMHANNGHEEGARWPSWVRDQWDLDVELYGWRWPRWKTRCHRASGRPRSRGLRKVTDAGRRSSAERGRVRTPARRMGLITFAYAVATLFWAGVTRYGEARHPGPAAGNPRMAGSGTVLYPRPLRPGFRDIRCSGFGRSAPGEQPLDDLFQLEVESVNATAWRSAVRRIERSPAQVLLVQETKVLARDIPKMSAQARRRGWQTLWSPAIPGKRGKASGGVAICAKLPVALSGPPRGPSEVVQGRVVAGMIEAPGCRPTVVYSGYFKDGVGANEENLGYLARVGAHCGLQPEGVQKLVGADFNMTPDVLEETGFPSKVDGTIINPGGGVTTCRTAKAASLIDYFVVSKGMAKGVECVSTIERSGIKTHTPVALRFHARLTSLKALALRKPPALGTEALIGPRLPPPDWTPLTRRLGSLAEKASRVGRAAVEAEYQQAFERWADLAEQEIHAATGEPILKAGLRGRAPRLFWRSILPEKVDPRAADGVVAVRALGALVDDARRIGRTFADADARGPCGDDRRAALRSVAREMAAVRGMPGAAPLSHLTTRATDLIEELLRDGHHGGSGDAQAHPPEAAGHRPELADAADVAAVIGPSIDDQRPERGGGERDAPAAGAWDIDGLDLEDDPFADLNEGGEVEDEMLVDEVVGSDTNGPEGWDGSPPEIHPDECDGDTDADDEHEGHGDADELDDAGGLRPWTVRMQALADEVSKFEKRETRAELAAALTAWRDWVKENAHRGLRNAHAHSKTAVPWTPTTTLRDEGTITADPLELLRHYRNKFRGLWEAADYDDAEGADQQQGPADCDDLDDNVMQPLPLLLPEQLREAAKSFSASSASTFDGFKLRHYSLLTDEALGALAIIFQVAETTGFFPRQLRAVPVPLLAKPKGGHRPIGIFTSPYRLWVKARRPQADEWESLNDRPYWASGKARSAQDVVWRQAVRAEIQGARAAHSATLLWDADAFYERVSHRKLRARARSTGFPEQLLRPALGMYRAPRLVSMNGFVARELLPQRGVVAGCGFANTLMKVYCKEPFDGYIKKVGKDGGDFDAYVDDFAVTVEGDTETDVIERLDEAHHALKETIEVDLEAVVAVGKAGLITTSDSLAKRIRSRIGLLAGVSGGHATNLGFNLYGGRRRTKKKGNGRGKRLLGAFARRHRIASMAGVLSRRQLRAVYTAGVAPSGDYEAAVNGLTDGEVLLLRRTAAAAVAPRGRGRSLTMALLLAELPTWCSELAPALQFGRAVWRASTGATRGNDLDLAELARAWADLNDGGYFGKLLKAKPHASYGAGGASARHWNNCRGPIGAMALSLDRVRWSIKDAFTWLDDWGQEVQLTTTSPALLKILLKEAALREAQRKVASTWAMDDGSFAERRVCTDILDRVLRTGRQLTPLEKGALASTAAGALWTRDRAYKAGYDVENTCPLCGAQGDTAHHRVWCCPATAAARAKLPTWIIDEARGAPSSSHFWTTGVFPHPGDTCPRPSSTLIAECEDAMGEDIVGITNWGMGGQVFVDGSCTRKSVKELQRAACAVVMLGDNGRPAKVIRAVVPAPLPQTPQAAEFIGFMLGFRMLVEDATVYSDCKNVVDTVRSGFPLAMHAKRTYAGLLRDMLKWPQQRKHLMQVSKVKAHQDVGLLTDEGERTLAEGNAAADLHAKRATELHPGLPQSSADEVAYWEARAELVAVTTARAMAMFPPMGRRLVKVRPGSIRPRAASVIPRDGADVQDQIVHDWRHAGGKWRCRSCAKLTCGEHVPAQLLRQRCPGPKVNMSAEAMTEKGHDVAIASANVPFAICLRCGAYAMRRVYAKLSNACVEATTKGRQSLDRLHRGLPPWDGGDRAVALGMSATVHGRWITGQGWVGITTGPREYDDDGPETRSSEADAAPGGAAAARDAQGTPSERQGAEDAVRNGGPSAAQLRIQAVKRRVRCRAMAARAEQATHMDIQEPVRVAASLGGKRPSEGLPCSGGGGTADDGDDMHAACRRRIGAPPEAGEEEPVASQAGEERGVKRDTGAADHGRAERECEHDDEAFGNSGGATANGAEPRPSKRSRIRWKQRPPMVTQTATGETVTRKRPAADGCITDGVSRDGGELTWDATGGICSEEDLKHRSVKAPKWVPRLAGSSSDGAVASMQPAEAMDADDHSGGAAGTSDEARAKGISDYAVSAREGLGGPPHEAWSTAAAASCLRAEVAAAVRADCGAAALLHSDDSAARGPPSGRAAPLEGFNGDTGDKRPVTTSSQAWPTSLGARPSNSWQDLFDDDCNGPGTGDERRRDGADAPASAWLAARGGADAAVKAWWEEPAAAGSNHRVPSARNECSARDATAGVVECAGAEAGRADMGKERRRSGGGAEGDADLHPLLVVPRLAGERHGHDGLLRGWFHQGHGRWHRHGGLHEGPARGEPDRRGRGDAVHHARRGGGAWPVDAGAEHDGASLRKRRPSPADLGRPPHPTERGRTALATASLGRRRNEHGGEAHEDATGVADSAGHALVDGAPSGADGAQLCNLNAVVPAAAAGANQVEEVVAAPGGADSATRRLRLRGKRPQPCGELPTQDDAGVRLT